MVRQRMRFLCCLEIGAILISMPLFAERLVTETVDFTGGVLPAGWTVANGAYVSSEYSNAVSRIALSYGASGAGQPGEAQLFAIDHSSSAETQIASVNAFTTGAAFDFPATSDYRRFRIVTSGLTLASFSATWLDARLDPPTNVVATALTTDSLEVSWDAVNGASRYMVSAWTNDVVGASAGNVAWEDTLPGATNGASSTRMSEEKFNNCFANAGWTRSEKAGYPTGENGTIRIGIAGESGWLQTPSIEVSGSGVAVVFHARAGASNSQSMNMSVERVSGEDVIAVGEVELSTEMKKFRVLVPDWNSGDRIRFNSLAVGDRRTIIGSVALLTGYSTGVSSRVVVKEISVADATSCTISGMPRAVPVFVGVSAIDAGGVPSTISAGVEVDLANPPPRSTLNACPIGGLAGHVYSENCDSLAAATSTTGDKDFYNGITLPFWQAWQGSDSAAKFAYYAGGNQTGTKFVALATDINDSSRAFGARTKQDTTMTWGLAFTNDTGSAVSLTNVSYSAQQWGFANTTNQLFSCEYLVTNRLDWIVSFSDGWRTCAETDARVFAAGTYGMPEYTIVDCVPPAEIRIAPGAVLYLKWTLHPPAKGSSALMAIDDLAVAFKVPEPGLVLTIANAKTHANVP